MNFWSIAVVTTGMALQAYLEDLLAQLFGRPIPIVERLSGIHILWPGLADMGSSGSCLRGMARRISALRDLDDALSACRSFRFQTVFQETV